MELEKEVIQETTQEQQVQEVKPTQETQPETKKEEAKEEVKQLTQKQIDEMIEKRLSRQKEAVQREWEAKIAQKELELSEKLKTIEAENKTVKENLTKKDLEITKLQYNIKEDKFDEALALRDLKISKNPSLDPTEALKTVLKENPQYSKVNINQIGIEVTNTKDSPKRYDDNLSSLHSFLPKR